MKIMIMTCVIIVETGIAEGVTVIHDSGDTLSISPYAPSKESSRIPKRRENIPFTMNILPIKTSNMRPGVVSKRQHSLPHFQTPLFVIGSDALSKQWLETRREQLIALNAVGILVSAETEKDIHDIKKLSKGLWIFPASGEDIAKELNLSHYPALISRIGIEQ